MAAIAIGDCTVTVEATIGNVSLFKIVTPATADDTDTVDVSTIMEEVVFGFANGATDNNNPIVNTTSTSIVLPGSTDNEARTCYVWGKSVQSTGGST